MHESISTTYSQTYPQYQLVINNSVDNVFKNLKSVYPAKYI